MIMVNGLDIPQTVDVILTVIKRSGYYNRMNLFKHLTVNLNSAKCTSDVGLMKAI